MNWSHFTGFALPSVACWLAAGILVYTPYKRWTNSLMIIGIALLGWFIAGFWIHLERPPMRTMGETRLWYSFFLSFVGYIAYRRWNYAWLLSFSAWIASGFILVNLLKPENHSQNLMPALQSIWFVPHVISYILSYAFLGAATIASFWQLRTIRRTGEADKALFRFTDHTVYAGFGLLLLGMLMGAVWAKEAWGNYWTWDPKETWALVTTLAYLAYIHLRLEGVKSERKALLLLPVAFLLLMVTWIGVNYLPSAQNSIHVY